MFTQDQINAYLWRKQGFGGAYRSAREITDGLIGLYGAAPTCYLSLLARGPGFKFPDLDDALYARRSLARLRCMRNTLFLLPEMWMPIAYQATKRFCQSDFQKIVTKMGVSQTEYQQVADDVTASLETQRLTTREIKSAVKLKSQAAQQAFNFIIALMCAEGRLVRANVRGGWKSNLYVYGRFEDWLPHVDLEATTPEQARVALARLYFSAYGPATVEDLGWWSGFNKSEAEGALRALQGELAPIAVHGVAHEYILLERDLPALDRSPEALPPGVVLLPVWDGYLMAYKQRARYVPERWYDRVYDGGGNATSTVLIDGRVGGIWDMETQGKQLVVKVSLFEPADDLTWRAIQAFADRLAQAVEASKVNLFQCPNPPALGKGSKSRFQSPLNGCECEEVLDR